MTEKRLRIYPYNSKSMSANKIRNSIQGALKIKRNTDFVPDARHVILNWGCSKVPEWPSQGAAAVLNHPNHVAATRNKITCYGILSAHDVPTMQWTADLDQAKEWADGTGVVFYQTPIAYGGMGIQYIKGSSSDAWDDLDIGEFSYFTKYIPNKEEYRIHVFLGEVIDFARKRRKKSIPDEKIDWKIRSHKRGWIFARQEETLPPGAADVAKKALDVCSLHFGAVDLLNADGNLHVVEINTAPGLRGQTTTDSYVEAITEFMESL